MKQALIFGAGGHAGVIASFLPDFSVHFIVQAGNDAAEKTLTLDEDQVFTHIDDYRDASFFIGIGENRIREALFHRLLECGITPANCIAPNAFIAPGAQLGRGVFIGAGAIVMTNARIGDNVIVNTLSSVDHDCSVGDHSQITGAVTFGGGASVGTQSFVGLKCAILPGISIGNRVTVLAGSVVTKDLPDGVTAGGYPARIVKQQ